MAITNHGVNYNTVSHPAIAGWSKLYSKTKPCVLPVLSLRPARQTCPQDGRRAAGGAKRSNLMISKVGNCFVVTPWRDSAQ